MLFSDVVDKGDGTYSVNVTGDTAGIASITAADGAITSAPVQVTFTAVATQGGGTLGGGGTGGPTRGRPLPPKRGETAVDSLPAVACSHQSTP